MSRARIIVYVVIFFFLLAALSAVSNWYGKTLTSSTTEYIRLPQPKSVTKIKEVAVPGPPVIITLDKIEAVKKLDLPDWVKNDTNKQVTQSGEVAPYEGVTDVEAIFDMQTGKTELIAKQKSLPFFAFENKKELSIRAGYSTDDWKTRSTVSGRWKFFRVGSAHLGLYGEVNSRGEGIGQLELTYQF